MGEGKTDRFGRNGREELDIFVDLFEETFSPHFELHFCRDSACASRFASVLSFATVKSTNDCSISPTLKSDKLIMGIDSEKICRYILLYYII